MTHPSGGGQAQPPADTGDTIIRPELDKAADLGATGCGGSGRGTLLLALLVFAGVLAAIPVGIVGKKARRRRRRRRAGSAAARIAGAWREVRDRLAERGAGRSRALTGDELVDRTRAPRGDRPADRLADLVPVVDLALFAGYEPDDATARHTWQLVAATSGELRRTDGSRRRLAAALNPRPLLTRR